MYMKFAVGEILFDKFHLSEAADSLCQQGEVDFPRLSPLLNVLTSQLIID